MKDLYDYEVFDESGESIGSVLMEENIETEDMPDELEINGVYYYAQK